MKLGDVSPYFCLDNFVSPRISAFIFYFLNWEPFLFSDFLFLPTLFSPLLSPLVIFPLDCWYLLLFLGLVDISYSCLALLEIWYFQHKYQKAKQIKANQKRPTKSKRSKRNQRQKTKRPKDQRPSNKTTKQRHTRTLSLYFFALETTEYHYRPLKTLLSAVSP